MLIARPEQAVADGTSVVVAPVGGEQVVEVSGSGGMPLSPGSTVRHVHVAPRGVGDVW